MGVRMGARGPEGDGVPAGVVLLGLIVLVVLVVLVVLAVIEPAAAA
jgi:hypothetical protein